MTTVAGEPSLFFTQEEIEEVQRSGVPTHIAIIPDGNRRWAKGQSKESKDGHQQGADGLLDIIESASDLGVQALTFYTFSTENWSRPQEEVDALMALLEIYLTQQRPKMVEKGVCLKHIGDITKFPDNVLNALKATEEATQDNTKITVYLALNYGSRDEITRAIRSIVKDAIEGKIAENHINEELISGYLDTAEVSDPELLIRTSGEHRSSNYLLWQMSYSEYYFTSTLWPDFTPQHLKEAILEFQQRERREGK